MMRYEAVIGLEIHIQLHTNSKLFSESPNSFGDAPNENTNELDLGYPGVLPVLNKQAVIFASMFGKAISAHINSSAFFMRKNYFYPDLPKGYQISQLDDAIIQGGCVKLDMGDYHRTVRINRGQLEEDAGKSVHDAFSDRTGIDLNRAGVPLIELVTEPDMRSAKEAVSFMKYIHHLVRYLGISDGNMQEGSFRCDANVSIREKGSDLLNPRVELKNINSFRFVEQAINIEIERQSDLMDAGMIVEQETRLFDAEKLETRTMRSKEEANDYRYFPDPDLLPLHLDNTFLEEIDNLLPELPAYRTERYQNTYALDAESIQYLLQNTRIADYFDSVAQSVQDGKLVVNWMQNELSKFIPEQYENIEQILTADKFTQLLIKVKQGDISATAGKKVLTEIINTPDGEVEDIICRLGLVQVNDNQQLSQWIDEVIAAFPEQVAALQNGQQKMLGFFVGQALKRSGGKANPKLVSDIIKEKLL